MAQVAETQGRSIEDERGQLILSEVNNAVHSTFNALAQKQIIVVDSTPEPNARTPGGRDGAANAQNMA